MHRVNVLAITSLLAISGAADDAPPNAGSRRLIVQNATAEQSADLTRAISRFDAARLTLPDLNIRFSNDAADCNGHLGIFDHATAPATITICSDLAFVPTHELAHAWIETNVDHATRDRYLQARHLQIWNAKSADWTDRGVEDAAFIVQQNLMMSPRTPLSPEWQRRVDAYETLTGRASPILDASTDAELGDGPGSSPV